jgi:hypothetical protein
MGLQTSEGSNHGPYRAPIPCIHAHGWAQEWCSLGPWLAPPLASTSPWLDPRLASDQRDLSSVDALSWARSWTLCQCQQAHSWTQGWHLSSKGTYPALMHSVGPRNGAQLGCGWTLCRCQQAHGWTHGWHLSSVGTWPAFMHMVGPRNGLGHGTLWLAWEAIMGPMASLHALDGKIFKV